MPKPDAGVEGDPLRPDPGRARGGQTLLEEDADLAGNIPVSGVFLHGARRALHVHEDDTRAGPGGDGSHRGVGAQGGHIVDDRGPARDGGFGHRRLRCIDRDQSVRGRRVERTDDREHAAHFLFGRDGSRAGPGGFTAHVDDPGTLREHVEAMLHRAGKIEEIAAVRERIRRDVQDAHDDTARSEIERAAGGLPDHGLHRSPGIPDLAIAAGLLSSTLMPMRSTLFIMLLTLGIGVAGWGWGWHEHTQLASADFTRQRLGFLEIENRRLGDFIDAKQRTEELAATTAQRTAIEHEVTNLRELPFLRRVTYREIPRSQLPAILSQKLAQQVPDKEFGSAAVGLAALGLLPPGLDLKKTYLGLLGEQIGAFYDQHSQELFTFSGQSLNNSQNRVILAHELTHALEDQQFNLSRLPLEAKGNDDRALAASALVEGDATLVMNRYMTGNLSAAVIKESLASAFTTDVRQLAAAPRYLRETLLFPYLRGLNFCQSLYDHSGWDALAEAFRRPPASTAEILHPERFWNVPRWQPITVVFTGTAARGQEPVDDNVLGEFGVRQLLGAWLKDDGLAAQVAAGWRGDRYLVYGDRAASSYVWRTRWEDAVGARRFVYAMKNCLAARYKNPIPPELETGSSRMGGRTLMLTLSNATEVTLIDAQDAEWFSALQSLAAASQPPQ